MKLRWLAYLPVGLGVLSGAAAAAAGEHQGVVILVENEAGKALAVAGCFAAALAFEAGDYLRRAWSFYGACFLLLLVNDGLTAVLPASGGLMLAQIAIVAVANASSVVSTWMLAHAFHVAGLGQTDDERRRGRLALAGAAVASLAITGWPLVHDVVDVAHGRVAASISIASDLGDGICLVLVAPVLLTAFAMRGGLLRWPWGLLAASGLAWIVYDALSDLVTAMPVGPGVALAATEAVRALANATLFSAGIAQRMTVAPEPPTSAGELA